MAPVTEPFPISNVAGRYLLFDVDVISHVRRNHNICGVLIGTIPNLSQQNVFLGIPLQLMPEEARVLVEQGHAYIFDDAQAHMQGFFGMSRKDRLEFLRMMDERGQQRARDVRRKAEERSEKALREKGLLQARTEQKESEALVAEGDPGTDAGGSLFGSTPQLPANRRVADKKLAPHFITPTTSYPPLAPPSQPSTLALPEVPRQYPIYRYMQSKGYFAMPGLRFGCHYSIYPGDPLRFHSHFLTTGLGWDEEFELLDIVGGGRLGTSVKKTYLIGAEEPEKEEGEEGKVRAFSIEWAGM
ncbi:SEN34 subunit of tRNA-splicing endonuclease [Lojkania enalia]|uniref:tRNA-splicing endonuclease subunit Sen34 n=1 Tax=Lojkania enalia TaxID=147567 RepID=A0A9P4JZD1_9PLEO|nr:SEN34 subunit of tRNA-splicing endonuclease [Didymosphaeria enalia]